MPTDGEDPAAGGVGPLSGSAGGGSPAADTSAASAVAQRMSGIGIGIDGTTADAGGLGSGMPPSHPGAPPQSVPSSAPSYKYIPPGQSLMTAVEWSPIVHDGRGKDTVMEVASKVAPLPPNFTAADAPAQRSGDIAEGSAGLDIDQVLGLVDGLPDPASMPEPTPVGSLAIAAPPARPAGSTSASASTSTSGVLGGTSAAPKASAGVSYPTTAGMAPSTTPNTSAPAMSTIASAAASGGGESESGDRRQRRLERNRESARASRRRRKVYLEELEEKVVCLSEEMDHGRRDHVQRALGTVMQLRMDRLKEVERDLGLDLARLQIGGTTAGAETAGSRHKTRSSNRSNSNGAMMNPALEHHVRALDTYLSRTSDELRLAEIFHKQQLLSLSLPQHRKFVMWLTIQNDIFYRGGRAASERLSAARIGERMIQNGIDRAPPSGDMWPLFCNDVGLSYDQEEKIRAHQRALLMEPGPWLHRHTAAAADATIEGSTRAVNCAAEMTQGRERSALDVLTIEQRAKFQAWAASRKDRIERLVRAKARAATSMLETSEQVQQNSVGLQTSPDRCDAANLYIINDRLDRVCSKMPPVPPLIKPTNLKKLSRRASFESLGSSMAILEGGDKKSGMSREKSFASTGSLKRSAASMSDDSLASKAQKDGPAPESAEAASAHLVTSALNDVRDIIPKAPPREFINISPPHPARGKPPSQRQSYARQQQQPQPQQQLQQDFLHQGGYARATPPAYNPGSPIGLPLSPLNEPTPVGVTSGGGGVDADMILPDGRPVPLPTPVHSMGGAAPLSQLESDPGSFVESNHGRVPSFLPQHMNILPAEEGFLNGVAGDGSDPTDMLFDLNEEDWALGLDMEE